jgi:poly(A) polymerase
MIKQFLQKVFGKRGLPPGQTSEPGQTSKKGKSSAVQVITASKHKINPKLISQAALKTCDGLQKAGFEAYIVGGAVRDLLLNHPPKDFDIATNATPEQVHKTFRRSRIIGRRFRLVHVLWGQETIEVSTFRGRIIRDNIFGSIEEDAVRRDFTANALYYDPKRHEVLDFHNGVADIRAKTLRIIGDPVKRYQEDPVRMLRAVRLSAKLGLKLEQTTEAPIRKLADLLEDVPPSRLFDEMLKLFLSGHAIESIGALRAQHLHHGLLPLLDVVLEQPLGEKFVMLALKNTDDRILAGKSSNPSFLFATLLWHEVLQAWLENQKRGEPLIPALHLAMNEIIDKQGEKMAIHNRYTATMKEIWAMQPRFEQRSGKRPYALLTNPKYRAGYDFLLLRCASGELPEELGEWWTRFADAGTEERTSMLLPDSGLQKRRRRPRKKKPAATNGESA